MQKQALALDLPPVSVIIPAYNEEKWVGTTVSSVLESGFPCELIVVDDGSTDSTPRILASFSDRATIITHAQNRGKGAAVASGLRAARGEIVIFCDAHVLGLHKSHLLMLTIPLVFQQAEVVIGAEVPPRPPLTGFNSPMWILNGQRAYYKKHLMPLLDSLDSLGFGLEVFLHNRFRDLRTIIVPLPGMQHLLKKDTSSPKSAALAYAKEMSEVVRAIAGIESLTPRELTQFKDSISLAFAEYWPRGREEGKQSLRSLRELLGRSRGPHDESEK